MITSARFRVLPFFISLLLLVPFALSQTAPTPAPAQAPSSQATVAYIEKAWATLTRSLDNCETLTDPKQLDKRVPLYLPHGVEPDAKVRALRDRCGVEVRHLPEKITRAGQLANAKIQPHALLYLPHDYVVPGGRFNEMYGWDSYFIIRGLLRSGHVGLARGMVENFFYEIEHYGAVLNANRTYYLSRSQPPFLSAMVRAVYDTLPAGKERDAWLKRAYRYVERDYRFWTSEPHLAGSTELSRYYDFGEGPVPELEADDNHYYRDVVAWAVAHPEWYTTFIVAPRPEEDNVRSFDSPDPHDDEPRTGPTYPVFACNTGAAIDEAHCTRRQVHLAGGFYKGDRAMRESGFDISFRFGPWSRDTHNFAPVDLNSLLFMAEQDLEWMAARLGSAAEAAKWKAAAAKRAAKMRELYWSAGPATFFDHNLGPPPSHSNYPYLTMVHPLWTGWATKQEALSVAEYIEKEFEHSGGLAMSDIETGVQWDYPYGWAPLHLIAVEGLRRYGFHDDADRIARKFLTMVDENFARDGTIREKYNVVTRSSETPVTAGYRQNVIGFGWTNGVYLELLHGLRQSRPSGTAPPRR